jgi:hypothetical protein
MVVLGSGVLTFIGVAALQLRSGAHPTWVARGGEPVPSDFCYAMFPAHNAVPKFDAPNGAPIGVVDRALVNSQAERDAGGFVRMNDPKGTAWVRMDDLGFVPPDASSLDYFAAFKAEYAASAPGEFRSATLKLDTERGGMTRATLRLRPDDDHVEIYVYDISNGRATAVQMTRYFGPAVALGSVVPAAVVGCAVAGIVSTIMLIVGRRR